MGDEAAPIHLRVTLGRAEVTYIEHDGVDGGAIACGVPYVPPAPRTLAKGALPPESTNCTTDPRFVSCVDCRRRLVARDVSASLGTRAASGSGSRAARDQRSTPVQVRCGALLNGRYVGA